MPSLKNDARRNRGRIAGAGITVTVLAGMLAGCSTTGTSDVNVPAHDPRLRHPIMLSNEPEVLVIPVGMNGPALSPAIERAIRHYVSGYSQDGTGAITIQVPTASGNAVAAAQTGQAVHYALVRAGVPQNQIQVAPYFVGDHAKAAPMRLAYLRVKAVAPECGLWPETLPNDFDNKQYHNFGCASQQNLAAMVANPADFVAPEPMSPASGARRAKVLIDYSKGEETRSEVELLDSSLESSE